MKNIIVKIRNKIFDIKNKSNKLINKTFNNIILLRQKSISKKGNKSNLKFNARFEFLKTKIIKLRRIKKKLN